MKKITAYVNTLTVQALVAELNALGVRNLQITDYSGPSYKISHMKLLCADCIIGQVRSVIERIGVTGTACDHCFRVWNLDSGRPHLFIAESE